MADQRFCEQCGAALAAGLRFCEQCGQPVSAAMPPGNAHGGAAARTGATVPGPEADAVVAGPRRQSRNSGRESWARRLAPIAALALTALAVAWWLLEPGDPNAMRPAAPQTQQQLESDVRVPSAVATPPPSPVDDRGAPDVGRVEVDPALVAAQRRRDEALATYSRIAVGEIAGDIDAAREDYRAALEELEAVEQATARPPR
jgi:hypothetical protein